MSCHRSSCSVFLASVFLAHSVLSHKLCTLGLNAALCICSLHLHSAFWEHISILHLHVVCMDRMGICIFECPSVFRIRILYLHLHFGCTSAFCIRIMYLHLHFGCTSAFCIRIPHPHCICTRLWGGLRILHLHPHSVFLALGRVRHSASASAFRICVLV